MSLLSVVIPVYRAQASLPALYSRLCHGLDGLDWELICVCDGSPDGSLDVLMDIARRDSRCRVISLEHNVGQQEATLCGLSFARGQYVATMDDDLQHPPELLETMLNKLTHEGLDIVYAVPREVRDGWQRVVGPRLRDGLFWLLYGKQIGIRVSAFRVMTAALCRRVLSQRGKFNYFSAMVFSAPVQAGMLEYPYQPRTAGKSGYTLAMRAGLYLRIALHYGPLSRWLGGRGEPDPCPAEELSCHE